ncbi:MAG: hypothetical protein PUF27_05800 [Bacteroidales bacterium]|nr:hypothetical protein [Bacteroidales bacterium]
MTLHSSARRLNGSVAFARRGVSHAPCREALPGVLASALLSS